MKPIVITAWRREENEASSCEEVGIESTLSPLVPVLFLAVIQPPSISNSNALGRLNSNRSVSFNDSAPLSRPDFVVLAVLHQCTVARLLGHVECSKFSKKEANCCPQEQSAQRVQPLLVESLCGQWRTCAQIEVNAPRTPQPMAGQPRCAVFALLAWRTHENRSPQGLRQIQREVAPSSAVCCNMPRPRHCFAAHEHQITPGQVYSSVPCCLSAPIALKSFISGG